MPTQQLDGLTGILARHMDMQMGILPSTDDEACGISGIGGVGGGAEWGEQG